jgi:putative transposase
MMVVGPEGFGKRSESASPDLLLEMVGSFIAALMGAEADAVCGAPYGESSEGRGAGELPQRLTGIEGSTLGSAAWTWRSRSSAPAATTRAGPSSRGRGGAGADVGGGRLLPARLFTRRVEKLVQTLVIDRLSK